jgi:hypothetical protein
MKKIILLLLLLVGIMVSAQPTISPPTNLNYCAYANGYTYFNLTSNNIVVLDGQNPSLYNITYHQILTEAESGENAIPSPNSYYSMSDTVYVRVAEIGNPDNYAIAAFNITVLPTPPLSPIIPTVHITDTDGDGIATTDLTTLNSIVSEGLSPETTEINYYTTFESAEMQVSGIENPQSYDTQTTELYVRVNITGSPCLTINSFNVIVESGSSVTAPTGNESQIFTQGATLADLNVEGENIQWYETAEGDTPLNMDTVLVDDTTYYAAQSINGVESSQRLGVTVNLTADINDNAFSTLRLYPNPAEGILNIENVNDINTVSVTNTLGQKVFTKTINSSSAQVDVSSLSKGIYFVTVASGNASKTVKIIKE